MIMGKYNLNIIFNIFFLNSNSVQCQSLNFSKSILLNYDILYKNGVQKWRPMFSSEIFVKISEGNLQILF